MIQVEGPIKKKKKATQHNQSHLIEQGGHLSQGNAKVIYELQLSPQGKINTIILKSHIDTCIYKAACLLMCK